MSAAGPTPAPSGLPERELQGLLEILGEVHHAEDLESFRLGLLDVVPRVLPSAYTSYNEFGPDGSPLVAIVNPQPEAQWLERWGQLGHENPLVQRYLATRDPRAYRITDVIDHREFRRRELYRQVFAPLGVHHQLAVTLPAPPSLLVGLAVVAPDDYTDAQRHMLDLARPHLIQARANAAARERLRNVLAGIEAGLGATGDAIVVADAASRVEFASDAGRAVLERLAHRAVPDGAPLPDGLPEAAGQGRAVLRNDGGPPLVIRRLTVAGGTATVFLFERSAPAAPRVLLEGLGLTSREAEVLRALMAGRGTREAAADLGISPRTVAKHLQRIYAKLGVTDRVAAVAAAWAALDAGRAVP
ncbi:MAG: LuxR C-terminal-related transcriptional regulator [Solirubrobacteraceae bacterium]